MKTLLSGGLSLLLAATALNAQVPQLINYQGRVAVGSTNFDGTGQFKFAFVNFDGSISFWSNDGTSTAGSEPTAAVSIGVTKGLYSVLLGDTSITNMTVIPSTVFSNVDVRLRVWFDDGTNGSQLITPDQRFASVGYALMAGSVQPVPDMVFFKGAYGAGTSYAKNDLVTSTTTDTYFFSLADANLGKTPESNPLLWKGVTLSQLKNIKKTLTLSAPGFTSLLSGHVIGTNTYGGRVFYLIRATDGGSQIATEEGVMQYLGTANSITATVQTTDKLHLGTVNSGATPGFFNPGSQPGISIFDNVTFSSPAPIVIHEVIFRILDTSGTTVRLEP